MKLGGYELPTEEIGDTWQLEGVMYGNGHESIVMATPYSGVDFINTPFNYVYPTDEQWQAFLKQTDDPITPIGKAFVRKTTRRSKVWW